MESIFTYRSYKELLIKMKEIGEILTFSSYNDRYKCGFILRHDVDVNLEKAYDMFKIEKELGIKSTYFVLVTSDLYNINSTRNREILNEMCKNGFEIGLHFDPTIYGDITFKEMEINMKKEISVIENIVDKKIKSISLHNPSVHNMYPEFKGYKNAYSSEFFNPNLYISDSCKDFRGKDLIKFIEKGKENLIQILLHPIHFAVNEESYIISLNKIIENKIEDFDKSMYANKTYKNELDNKTLLQCFNLYIERRNNEE